MEKMKEECCGSGQCGCGSSNTAVDTKAASCCGGICFGSLILRVALGGMLFLLAVHKFDTGISAFVATMSAPFEQTWFPMSIVTTWLKVVPFIEVILGALLFLGLFTRYVAILTGFYFIILLFGGAILVNEQITLPLFLYLVVVIYLIKKPYSKISLDKLFGCKTC